MWATSAAAVAIATPVGGLMAAGQDLGIDPSALIGSGATAALLLMFVLGKLHSHGELEYREKLRKEAVDRLDKLTDLMDDRFLPQQAACTEVLDDVRHLLQHDVFQHRAERSE